MQFFKSKKRLAIVAGTSVALVGGGMAFAYWTTGGSGTGSATTGSASPLTVTASQVNANDRLVLDGTAVPMKLVVSNPNPYTMSLKDYYVHITPGSITCGDGTTQTTVPDSWFTLGTANQISSTTTIAAATGSPLVPAETTLSTPSGVALQIIDKPVNQDVCQGATVQFNVTVSKT